MFESITNWLKQPLAENSNANEDDIFSAKKKLQKLNSYQPQTEAGETKDNISKIPNQNLFDAIEKFQKENNLKADRIMKPEGETEQAINSKLKYTRNLDNLIADKITKPKEQKINNPNYKLKYGNDVDINLAKEMEKDTIFIKDAKKLKFLEGGYINNPNDPGGETKFGISKKRYPNKDIKNLTRSQADYLTYKDFYRYRNINTLPNGIREDVVNIGFNQGPERAIMRLQKIVGAKQDAYIGNKTISKIQQYNIQDIRKRFKDLSYDRYHKLQAKKP